MPFEQIIDGLGIVVDLLGVAAIVIGGAVAAWRAATGYVHGARGRLFHSFRQDLGRAILLGLEILIAADIIRTVAIGPTIENVVALGLIVLVRTFLSFSLEVELEGRLPWQRRPSPDSSEATGRHG